MQVKLPTRELAEGMTEHYQRDGVNAYTEQIGDSWYCVIDDGSYAQYQDKLSFYHKKVLEDHGHSFNGTNQQEAFIKPPPDTAQRLNLYIVDTSCKTAKMFQVTAVGKALLERQWAGAVLGTSCSECGNQTKVVIRWEEM